MTAVCGVPSVAWVREPSVPLCTCAGILTGLLLLCSDSSLFLGHESRRLPHPVVSGKPLLSSRPPAAQIATPALVSALGKGLGIGGSRVLMAGVPPQPCQVPTAPRLLPEVSPTYESPEVSNGGAASIHSQRPSAWDEVTDAHTVVGGRHVLTDKPPGVPMAVEDTGSCKVSARLKAFGH